MAELLNLDLKNFEEKKLLTLINSGTFNQALRVSVEADQILAEIKKIRNNDDTF
jgi:hypothetical protein